MLALVVVGPDSSSLRVASSAEPEQHGKNDNGIGLCQVRLCQSTQTYIEFDKRVCTAQRALR